MTPAQLARQATQVVDRVEAGTIRQLLAFIRLIEADTRDLLRGLELKDVTTSRVIRELRARQAVEQSTAARRLLSLGRAGGPLVEDFRAGIRESFTDGLRTARTAAVSTGVVTTTQAINVLAFGSRVDLDFLEALTRTTITTLERVSTTGVQRLTDAIARGAVRGAGPRATARLAREAVDLTRYEAERITRTVFMRANNEARDQTYAQLDVKYLQWDATNDSRVCPYCAARHGMVYERAKAPQPPLHPHCLVGDTHVLAEGTTGYSKRWYEGPVVTITTSNGDRLTVTPNHPILTPGGWVHAGALNVGSDVVAHRVRERVPAARLDDEHVEGPVEQVVDALGEAGEMAPRPVPVSSEDFHGDGLGSEVAVVGANRELWDSRDAVIEQHRAQAFLAVAIEHRLSLLGHRGAALRLFGNGPPSRALVCVPHLVAALLGAHSLPLQGFGFGPPARLDAVLAEPPVDDVAADAVAVREAVDALPGEVAVDQVVSVERRDEACHVYNLQTRRGWYVADGIVTHNCRCVTLPWSPDTPASLRGDEYYTSTRAGIREKLQADGRASTTATAAAPFEKADGIPPPKPIWAPDRGFL